MRIPRIYLATALQTAYNSHQALALDETARRHVVQVLRLRPGAEVILFDGKGGEYQAVLDEVSKRQVTARLSAFIDRTVESPLPVTLMQGISRGERMDLTLQKATELGVARIVPLLTERCGVNLSAERREKRQHHWQGVVTSACQQSGRTRLPTVAGITPLSDWLRNNPADGSPRLILDPLAERRLGEIVGKPATTAPEIALLIGPEGGLSAEESLLAQRHGFVPVALGPRILRTETAGIAAIAVLQALLGDL